MGQAIDPEFAAIFWPTLAATVVGVILGVPIALFISRSTERSAGVERRNDEGERLRRALRVLDAAMQRNDAPLRKLATIKVGTIDPAPELETTTWDAVRGEITPLLHNPELQARLAHHFSQVAHVIKLNDQFVEFHVGPSASMSTSEQMRNLLGVNLNLLSGNAVKQIEELRPLIQSAASQPAN